MGRTFRTTLFALVVAAAAGGCGDPAPDDQALDAAARVAMEVDTFCDAARENVAANVPLAAFAAEGRAPRPADDIATVVEPLRESNANLLEKAPVEIRPDAEAALALAEIRLTAFETTKGDAAAAMQDPAYLAKATEVQQPIDRLQGFFRDTCGIDID